MDDDVDWKSHFMSLFEGIAACEAPEESQVDEVLSEHQQTYDLARNNIAKRRN